jgi:hypothetical protein
VAFSPQDIYSDQSIAAAGKVSANFYELRRLAWSVQPVNTAVNVGFQHRYHYFFFSSSSSVITRLSGPRAKPTVSQKTLRSVRGSNPGPLNL